jgi:regulator of protease activity HflC (stomatin/prohibitin superfamily)
MEKDVFRISGFAAIVGLLALGGAAVVVLEVLAGGPGFDATIGWILAGYAAVAAVLSTGFLIVNPNDGQVIQFFGRYLGTIREAGLHWTVPLTSHRRVTLRVRNFETERLKVADADGNPVEIAAVVVWRVVDTAKATFAVDDYEAYVVVQAESAVRHLAASYPYDAHDSGRPSLREGAAVTDELTAELRDRVVRAGVEILESRTTHLAYAPEIAQAMLARQQAAAIVAARHTIVEGAVGMVSSALDRLRADSVVELDEERKAQMVSNLLVVLCGDRAAQPVVNAGTLY